MQQINFGDRVDFHYVNQVTYERILGSGTVVSNDNSHPLVGTDYAYAIQRDSDKEVVHVRATSVSLAK